jgi:hypothetical protein
MHREQIEFNVTPPVWLAESAWFWPTIAAVLAFQNTRVRQLRHSN